MGWALEAGSDPQPVDAAFVSAEAVDHARTSEERRHLVKMAGLQARERFVREHASLVERVIAAQAAPRCCWSSATSWWGANDLDRLLIVFGHERAARGDVSSAARFYLAAVRFGLDVRTAVPLAQRVSLPLPGYAAKALGELLSRCDRSALAAALPEIEAALGRLDAAPSQRERLAEEAVLDYESSFLEHEGATPDGDRPPGSYSQRELLNALPTLEAMRKDAVLVLEAPTLLQQTAAQDRINDVAGLGRGWFLSSAHTNFLEWRRVLDTELARIRLCGMAAALERCHATDGAYPQTFPGDVPLDPCNPGSPIQIVITGTGYRLASVGVDGRQAIALERR
jgi:hypothetical protein